MFVTSLEAMFCAQDGPESQIIQQPCFADVVQAVELLNGDDRDSVILNGQDGSYMGIVGGRDGKYVVAGRDHSGRSFILIAGPRGGKWVPVNAGGQENEYADNEIIPLDTVLVVARTFFERGECDHRYQWNEKAAKMSEA
jgi:hypothetical protein